MLFTEPPPTRVLMGGHHLRYPLPYPLPGFFSTTLPEPYPKSKNPTRPSLVGGLQKLACLSCRGLQLQQMGNAIARVNFQSPDSNFSKYLNWKRGNFATQVKCMHIVTSSFVPSALRLYDPLPHHPSDMQAFWMDYSN